MRWENMAMPRKNILIVEDEIFVALELEQIVESAGYAAVDIAADSESALALAEYCDIALVDLNLRDGPTGPQIGEALARDHGVRVIYVTANPSQIGAAAANALGFIAKPFQPATVRAALDIAASDPPPPVTAEQIRGFTPLMLSAGSSPSPE